MEITELWIAEDKWGNITLFTEEPSCVEGEWKSFNDESFELSRSLIDFTIADKASPQKVVLKLAEKK